jgi:hypothetical protein
VFSYQAQNSVHKVITTEVAQLAESHSAAQMSIAVGITSGTRKRAFPRNFDGKHGDVAGQNSSPRREHFTGPKTWVRDGWAHGPFDARAIHVAAFIFLVLTRLLTPNALVRGASGQAKSTPEIAPPIKSNLAPSCRLLPYWFFLSTL